MRLLGLGITSLLGKARRLGALTLWCEAYLELFFGTVLIREGKIGAWEVYIMLLKQQSGMHGSEYWVDRERAESYIFAPDRKYTAWHLRSRAHCAVQ